MTVRRGKTKKWWNSKRLIGLQAAVQRSINGSMNGAYASVDLGILYSMLEVIEQTKRNELEHEAPPPLEG